MTVSSEVNVRSGAGSSYSKLGVLATGEKVKVIGESNGWYQIDYNGNINAFVYSTYLSGEKPAFSTSQSSQNGYDYNNYNNYDNNYNYNYNNNGYSYDGSNQNLENNNDQGSDYSYDNGSGNEWYDNSNTAQGLYDVQ